MTVPFGRAAETGRKSVERRAERRSVVWKSIVGAETGTGGTMVVAVCEREGAALMYPNVVTLQRYRRRPRAASLREIKRVITTSVVPQNGQLTHVLSSPYGPKHRCLQHQMDSAQT